MLTRNRPERRSTAAKERSDRVQGAAARVIVFGMHGCGRDGDPAVETNAVTDSRHRS